MDFHFHMPVRVVSGPGCVRQRMGELREYGRRCLIITGQNSAMRSGALDDAMAALTDAGVDCTVFPGIGANPLISQCQAAAFAAEACRADFLVGIGGGSVLDATKAAAWIAENTTADVGRLFAGTYKYAPLPFALVGLTAGTGSEVSPVAVLTGDQDGRKRSVSDPCCYARAAYADPRYTCTMSAATTVSTALDALCHGAEGFLNPVCTDVADLFASRALPLLSGGLIELAGGAAAEPTMGLREQLFYGALWAGMVLNAMGTAYPHPLGYVLTEDFDVPHGMACAVFLPDLLRRSEAGLPERTARFYSLVGGKEAFHQALDLLVTADIRMTMGQVEDYARRWDPASDGAEPKNFARVAGGFTAADARDLFAELFVR